MVESGLVLKERKEGVRSCGWTDEAAYVSIRDEGVAHAAIGELCPRVFWT